MTDELTILRHANPVTPVALERAVAVDRRSLMEMLDADSVEAPRRLAADQDRFNRSATRAAYVGALAMAAALIVVALFGAEEPTANQDMMDPAADAGPILSDAVDDLDGDAASVEDSPAEVVVDVAEEPEALAGSASEQEVAVEAAPPTTTGTTVSESGPIPQANALPAAAPFVPAVDVLSVHLDYFHRDDGHAAVAVRELATWFGLAPHVVGGTAASEFDGYVHPFASVMDATWGDAWFDARSNRDQSLQATVDRWLVAIDDGGTVWVAEGGVSDFTAEVLVELKARRPELDTKNTVRVIQHSNSNEVGTVQENLQHVTANTSYVRIDDGNQNNNSANLNQVSEAFQTAALTGRHSQSWVAAFDYLPADKLDFSDTVEVLHILGITLDTVADPDDFAARFITPKE